MVPSIEEQLHVSDQGINSTPMFSNLKPENSSFALATVPKFYHATSCTNVAKEIQYLIRDEVRSNVDSLEATQIEQFNMGRNTTPKEKKGVCGRPRKSFKGVLSSNENISQSFSGCSSQETRKPKQT